jgi:hypothetical protein
VRVAVHLDEQLYASNDLTTVEIGACLESLARELDALRAQIADGIRLHIETEQTNAHQTRYSRRPDRNRADCEQS